MDPGAGVFNLYSSNANAFVAKYTSAGKLLWAANIGGGVSDKAGARAIAFDPDGDIIISGSYASTVDFDPGPGVFNLTSVKTDGEDRSFDVFILKLTTDGKFVWVKSIGGSALDQGFGIVSDSKGAVIAVVKFAMTITVGNKTFTNLSPDGFNGLVVKYKPDGSLAWAMQYADVVRSSATSCAVDVDDNVIVSGMFASKVNFNPLGAARNATVNVQSMFVAKYNPAGILQWQQTILNTQRSEVTQLCVNSKSEIYISGQILTPPTFSCNKTLLKPGPNESFIAKYNANGNFEKVIELGGRDGTTNSVDLVVDKEENLFISGLMYGTVDFDPSAPGTGLVTPRSNSSAFLAKYDEDLNYKSVFSFLNPPCGLIGMVLHFDSNNDMFFAGAFCSTVDFDPSDCGTKSLTASGSFGDGFFAKYAHYTPADNFKITDFSVASQVAPAVIDQNKLSITLTVPPGTNITNLKPGIILSSGVVVSPAAGVARDFTNPVTYKVTGNCQTLNYTVKVVFEIIPQKKTICAGDNITLTGKVKTPAPDSFIWQVQKNNDWQEAPGINSSKDYSTEALTNSTPTTVVYSLRRQTITGCDIAYDSYYDVSVKPATLITNNVITAPAVTGFCTSGNPDLIKGSAPAGGDGIFVFQWQSSADNVNFSDIAAATSSDFDPALIGTDVYYRRRVTSGNCTTPLFSNVIHIKIQSVPAKPVPVNAAPVICPGSSITLRVSSPVAGITYNWYGSSSATDFLFSGTNYPTGNLNTAKTYYLAAVNDQCSSELAPVQVTMAPVPTAPLFVKNTVSVCSGSNADLNILNPQAGLIYNWYTTASGGLAIHSGTGFTTDAIISATTYYVETVNTAGCISATRGSIVVTPVNMPQLSPISASACTGGTVTLTVTSSDADAEILWYDVADGGSSVHTGSSFVIAGLSTTKTYYAEAISAGLCVTPNRVPVQAVVLPRLDAPVAAVDRIDGNSIIFKWNPVAGAKGYKVSIDGGQNYMQPGSGSDGLSHTVSGLQVNQSVTLLVRAIGETECQLSDNSEAVTGKVINGAHDISVPNSFTPNGDGVNDTWVIAWLDNDPSAIVKVFDRYGTRIYDGKNYNSWNGRYQGKLLPAGTYYYIISTKLNPKVLSGSVTIIY